MDFFYKPRDYMQNDDGSLKHSPTGYSNNTFHGVKCQKCGRINNNVRWSYSECSQYDCDCDLMHGQGMSGGKQ